MNWIKSIFGSNTDNVQPLAWQKLTEEADIAMCIEESYTRPVVFFKHSPRCGISSMVLRRFEKAFDEPNETIALYLIDVIRSRAVSQALAGQFGVRHESPQLLVIRNGKLVAHPSHYNIDAGILRAFL